MFPTFKCDHCGKEDTKELLKRCSKCRMVYYCDSNCQKSAWKAHKDNCHPIDQINANSIDHIENDMKDYLLSKSNPLEITSSSSLFNREEEELSSFNEYDSSFCFKCFHHFDNKEGLKWYPEFNYLKSAAKSIYLLSRLREKKMNNEELSPEEELLCQQYYNSAHNHLTQFMGLDFQYKTGAKMLRSELYYVMNQFKESIQNTLTEINVTMLPEHVRAHYHLHLAKCYVGIGEYVSALKSYGAAIVSMEPEDNRRIISLMGCSRCFYELESYDKAIQSSEGAIVLNRHQKNVYTYIIKSYEKIGRLDLSVAWLKQAYRYETPWDESNVKKIKSLLEEYSTKLKLLQSIPGKVNEEN